MHGVNASDIDTIIHSQGGSDVVIRKCHDGYEVISMPVGTIDQMFSKEFQQSKADKGY